MSKRTATRQLTQDNWNDDDDEKESPGVYKSVDASVLQTRVIKKAKRTLPEAQEKLGQSPFSKFSGFGSKAGNSVPSLGFLMNICEKSVPQSANADASENKQNGPNSLKSELSEKTAASPALKNSDESSHSAKDSSCMKKTLSRDVQYYRHLKALNESVLQWVQMHTEKNPWCDLTPVFNDYRKHINTIEQKFPLKEKSSASPKAFKPFSFKVPSAPMQKICNSADEEKLGSGEKDSKIPKVSRDSTESSGMWGGYGAGFKSSTTNTSTFSFGIKPTTTATVPSSNSGPTSSCGSEKEKTENESSPFSFNVVKSTESSSLKNLSSKSEARPFTFAVKPVTTKDSENQQNNGVNDDEEYVPPKNEVVNIQEEGSVYSKRCKLFYKNDGTYKEKGVGTLYLKPIGGSVQLLIRGETVVGKILLNIKLASSLPMQRLGKNNVVVSCVPNPPIGPDDADADAKEPVSFLIRTKTGDDADELFDMLNKYKS